jgi:hypothetical protein
MQDAALQPSQAYVEDMLPPAELCDLAHATLFGEFENYAGIAANKNGKWPISWMHLSKPTGHYVSRFMMRCVNMLLRRHAILTVGNACIPGLFFPETDKNQGWEQFQFIPGQHCGCLVANINGHAGHIQNAVVFEAEPFMVLQLKPEWNAYSEYLDAMQSKYRVRAKKVFSSSKAYTFQALSGADITEEIISQCATLLKQTLKDKTVAMPEHLDHIITKYRNYFKTNYTIHLYLKEDIIVGFVSYIKKESSLLAMQLGVGDTEPKEAQLYQRMLHDIVDVQINLRKSILGAPLRK